MNVQERTAIYKADDGSNLKLHLFLPEQTDGQRAAILFFHGGRFIQGHPAQFFPHCRYLAARGMVAASTTYRLLGKQAKSVLDCMSDSRAAIRWLRAQADELRFDPTQLVVAGGSAGANLAANAAIRVGDEPDTIAQESRPDALVLFSPAVVRPMAKEDLLDEQLYAQLRPKSGLPPMLLLHGMEDEIFALNALQHFCEEMNATGNLCVLQLYPQGKHGFFNYGCEENRPFYETMIRVEQFLSHLGMLHDSSILSEGLTQLLREEDDWSL